MPRPAIFFDRDNTLIRNSGYLRNHREVVLLPGAAEAVAACRKLGFATITVSNQSGVARAMMSEADVRAVNARMDEMLRNDNASAIFDEHYYCPYHPDPAVASVRRYCVDSDLRKPKPGMLLLAAREHALDLPNSWIIGDAVRDIEAGHAAGCRGVLLRVPELEASPHATADDDGGAEFVAATLAEAVAYIEQHADEIREVPDDADAHDVDTADDSSPAPRETHVPVAAHDHVFDDILAELRRQNRTLSHEDAFSMLLLLAGVTQILALALLIFSYLLIDDGGSRANLLITAVFMQVLTLTLALMGRK